MESSLVPQRPSRLRDRWWWWCVFLIVTDVEVVPVDKEAVKLDPVGLAMGTAMVRSKKRRREIVESGYNRWEHTKRWLRVCVILNRWENRRRDGQEGQNLVLWCCLSEGFLTLCNKSRCWIHTQIKVIVVSKKLELHVVSFECVYPFTHDFPFFVLFVFVLLNRK